MPQALIVLIPGVNPAGCTKNFCIAHPKLAKHASRRLAEIHCHPDGFMRPWLAGK
jgi:hypothetical protein